MFSGRQKCDVLVSGAGPVGLFSALALAERGIDVQVLDEQWRTTSRSYALALHPGTMELLQRYGLADEILEHAHKVGTMSFYEKGERKAALRLTELGGAFPYLTILPQHALESALEQRLAKHKVKVLWNHRVAGIEQDSRGAQTRVQRLGKYSTGYSVAHTEWLVEKEYDIRSTFVAGADGHRSAVRRALGIDYDPVGSADLFAVFEFAASGQDGNEARVVLDEGATNVLWPLPGGRFRFSFQIPETPETDAPRLKSRLAVQLGNQAFPYLDADRLKDLIAERAPWFSGTIDEVFWSVEIRFERRLASSFGNHNLWLAGDSAHLAGPVGMHSMNVGLREAWDLTDAMAEILVGGAGEEVLARYAREREAEWKRLQGLAGPPQAGPGADPWVRSRAARIAACVPASGKDMGELLGQIGLGVAEQGATA